MAVLRKIERGLGLKRVLCVQRGELYLSQIGRGQRLWQGEKMVKLAPMTAKLMFAFMVVPYGYPLSEDELLELMYAHPDISPNSRTVPQYISAARRALEMVSGPPLVNRGNRQWELMV